MAAKSIFRELLTLDGIALTELAAPLNYDCENMNHDLYREVTGYGVFISTGIIILPNQLSLPFFG